MRLVKLPADYALVLQQIYEDGLQDFSNLAELLGFDRKRLAHIVQALQHKGLVNITKDMHREAWLSLSAKGQHLIAYVWPESQLKPSW
ncbi:MAG TPA: MarR family winged helix-turn-helix transcriptional regulator [Candidatus Acidoferrum sp.]|nr:MarR family winged helix-turn-helix transcriptional regulator [Candidatus Acidoferrum sp.]